MLANRIVRVTIILSGQQKPVSLHTTRQQYHTATQAWRQQQDFTFDVTNGAGTIIGQVTYPWQSVKEMTSRPL